VTLSYWSPGKSLAVTCVLADAALFIPCKEAMTAEEMAGLIMQHIFPWFGLPLKFISDQDPKFTSRFIQGLCKTMDTTQNISMVYHPRMDGQSK